LIYEKVISQLGFSKTDFDVRGATWPSHFVMTISITLHTKLIYEKVISQLGFSKKHFDVRGATGAVALRYDRFDNSPYSCPPGFAPGELEYNITERRFCQCFFIFREGRLPFQMRRREPLPWSAFFRGLLFEPACRRSEDRWSRPLRRLPVSARRR